MIYLFSRGSIKPRILLFSMMAIIIIMALSLWTSDAFSTPRITPLSKMIVIDPGHGGYDKGAVGTEQSQEKRVSLTVAMKLKQILQQKYQVRLTRTSDYWLEIPERAALANHLQAALFISIHTAGGFQHTLSGIEVYYFEPIPQSDQHLRISEIDTSTKIKPPNLWREMQLYHHFTSTKLAQLIGNQLTRHFPMTESDIRGLPIAALAGADMPAVLIEVGHLSNPADESKLNEAPYLNQLTTAIAEAIDRYFQTP